MSLPCLPPSTAVLPGVLHQQRLINPGKQTSPGSAKGCGIWWEPHKLQDWVAHHITPFPCLVPGKLLLKPHREMWHEPAARRCSCHGPQLCPRLLSGGGWENCRVRLPSRPEQELYRNRPSQPRGSCMAFSTSRVTGDGQPVRFPQPRTSFHLNCTRLTPARPPRPPVSTGGQPEPAPCAATTKSLTSAPGKTPDAKTAHCLAPCTQNVRGRQIQMERER